MKTRILLIVSLLLTNVAFAQIITTIAGTGTAGYSGDGGAATAAMLNQWTSGVIADKAGNIYITDNLNNRVRKVDIYGTITTIAGTGSAGYSGDGGPATAARLYGPTGIAIDGSGNIYVSDRYSHTVRKINTSGIITTVAGTGSVGFSGDGGAATNATLNSPDGLAVDNTGNVYIADWYNYRVRVVNPSGIISTFAGTGATGYTGDGGPATAATFTYLSSVTTDLLGNLYITDGDANVVRKIDPSGIITTVAGTGASGYGGDGGPATAAQLGAVRGVTISLGGDIYIGDRDNERIRKVSPTGIITTIAGSGSTGYSGDGGPAMAASFNSPNSLALSTARDLYICDGDVNSCIRKVQRVDSTISSDSFRFAVNKYCSGPTIIVAPKNYSAGLYVKTYFGDGLVDSTAIRSTGAGVINHSYNNNGAYSIKHVLHRASGLVVDSFQYTYFHHFCNALSTNFYYDANSNCSKDGGDAVVAQPVLIEVDSNSVAIDTLSATSGIYYTAFGARGDVYAFKVLTTPAGLHVTCPSTGIIYDTLSTGSITQPAKNMGLECITGSGFDLSVHAVIPITGTFDQQGDIYVQNAYCAPVTGTVTLHHSMKYSGTPAYVTPSPVSITPNTIVWNIASLSGRNAAPDHIHYVIYVPGSLLPPGDTVQSFITVDPETGDADTSDNTDFVIDTVRVGCDPNAIYVKPGGCIASGAAATQLQYAITFENTGNDTAHNIHVMDTLPNYVDPSSMRLVLASHEMYSSKLKDAAGHTILKFDFPNIKLLDSSHHGLCDGAVIYTINTKPGLTNGTDIMNRVGIYFDVNPVVMTNEAHNVIGCPIVGVAGTSRTLSGAVAVYPNPASDVLNIRADNSAFESYAITNNLGSVVASGNITRTQTEVNIKSLPAGMYFVGLSGAGGRSVVKFVKEQG